MTEHNGDKEISLNKQEDIDTLRDYVLINLRIHSGGTNDCILNTPVKLQNKLEDELSQSFLGATGKAMTMVKLFYGSNLVDKEALLSSLKDIKDEIYLFATTGYSKSYTFKRFIKPYEWPYWGYYGTTIDAIAFVPNQSVVLCGFALYSTDKDSFEVKYKIYVDDVIMEEEDNLKCYEWEDKFYCRLKTKNLIEIKAGSKLEITTQIAKQFSNNEYVSCYYGDGGDRWATVENEHMGLWTVEASSKSGSSSVGYGNFPEIMYYI